MTSPFSVGDRVRLKDAPLGGKSETGVPAFAMPWLLGKVEGLACDENGELRPIVDLGGGVHWFTGGREQVEKVTHQFSEN